MPELWFLKNKKEGLVRVDQGVKPDLKRKSIHAIPKNRPTKT